MRLVVGHANPDFDAYAATVAAARLFDGAYGVFLGSQNANVREFHNMHHEFLPFTDLKGLELEAVTEIVMVDTRDPARIGELGPVVRRPGVRVIVYDHHPAQADDIVPAEDRSMDVGATTSILVHEIMRAGVELTPLEASLFALGIHEDTGSLTFPGSTAFDAEALAWLMSAGADTDVLNRFLARTLDPGQRDLLAQLESSLRIWDIHGQSVAVGVATTGEYVDSAGVLTHHVVEDLGYRVAFGVVTMPERTQIVARSRVPEVDVGAVMARLGGGGHPQAASAGFRTLSEEDALARVREALLAEVRPPLRAVDVMSAPVRTIGPDSSMEDAGVVMSRWGHGGLPVEEDGRLVGMVTRKDVDKAVRHRLDHAPVRGFMGRDVITVARDTPLTELERLMAGRGIGRIPVLSGGRMVGIVTRKDVLRAQHGDSYLDHRVVGGHPAATAAFLGGVRRLLPGEVTDLLERVGRIAEESGLRAHVVGGFVRDMLIGVRNLDIDIVVEGDGIALAKHVGADLGAKVDVHERFGTAVVVASPELHIDFASSRSEYYTKPGALPTVEPSTLRQDLFRRDFTINAMAACVDPSCFGSIADPFGGLSDLESRTVRVLHAISFVDDPTRVLRAVRFETRYDFRLDEHSEQLARRAVQMGLLAEVPGTRLRQELLSLIDEPLPVLAFERLHEIGALAWVLPRGADPVRALADLRSCEVSWQVLSGRPGAPSLTDVLVTALASMGTRRGCELWIGHLRIGRQRALAARSLASGVAAVLRLLEAEREPRASRIHDALARFPAPALYVLHARTGEKGRRRIELYIRELMQVRMAVDGRDLLAMGATPGEAFSAILARARDDRLDGRAVGRDAELRNLRRLAVKAGLIQEPRPDSR